MPAKPRRRYPAAAEKLVPVALAVIAIAIVVLVIVAILVASGRFPAA
jgi:hypothetical protein